MHTATIEAVEMVVSASTGGGSGEITVEGLAEEIANLTNKFVETEQTVDDKISEFRTELDTSISSVNSTLSAKLSKSETKYITATWSSGTSWYRKYSDGWVEQGGSFNPKSTGTLTFNTSFSSTNYIITVNDNEAFRHLKLKSYTTSSVAYTQINVSNGNTIDDSERADWYACGY